ncbi:hypothetical protein B484DRAFT_410338, partial [Ochromonadaceae sp. CCMP2298]
MKGSRQATPEPTMTFSDTTEDGRAELEVLKAILNRESYLSRLRGEVRKISRKFKPEVGDALDFVREASLDVVDTIAAWREGK